MKETHPASPEEAALMHLKFLCVKMDLIFEKVHTPEIQASRRYSP
jgi:hypothetical protein